MTPEPRPTLGEALELAQHALMHQQQAFGEVMEAHGIEAEDFMPVAQDLVPTLLRRYGPVHGLVAGLALGLLAGMQMGLPTLTVPDTLPEDFNAKDV